MRSVNLRQRSRDHTTGKDSLFSKWCWEHWTATGKWRKLGRSHTAHTWVRSRWTRGRLERKTRNHETPGRKQAGSCLTPVSSKSFWTWLQSQGFGGRQIARRRTAKKTISETKDRLPRGRKRLGIRDLVSQDPQVHEELTQLNTQNKTQQSNPKQCAWKRAEDPNRHFPQRRQTAGQQVQEKVLTISHQQGDANQIPKETSPRPRQNGRYQKDKE